MDSIQLWWTVMGALVLKGAPLVAQQRGLYEYLFRNYTPVVRPVLRQDTTTTVAVKVYFKQVLKVSESDQILKIYLWLEQYWVDEYLTWEPNDFEGMSELHVPADLIWKPDLTVYNNANMNIKENELQTNALLNFQGNVSLYRAVITDITCALDMEHFPFDQQFCHIMIASWSLGGKDLNVNLIGEDTITEYYTANLEWSLNAFKARKNQRYYDCCPDPYPDISFYFVIRRNPGSFSSFSQWGLNFNGTISAEHLGVYYMLTLIVPSAFITIVTVVGFFTPHSSSGENTEKVSLGVTALLSLAIILMMVSDKLPATSKVVPLLGQYYVGLILIMFMATCATTITLTVQMKGNGGRRLPPKYRRLLATGFARLLTTYYAGDKPDERKSSGQSNQRCRTDSIKLECSKSDTTLSLLAAQTNTTANGSMLLQVPNHTSIGAPVESTMNTPSTATTDPDAQKQKTDPLPSFKDTYLAHKLQQATSGFSRSNTFAHICPGQLPGGTDPSSGTGGTSGTAGPSNGATSYASLLQAPLRDLVGSIDRIADHLSERKKLEEIRSEWQQMARLCDRLMMIIFIMITVCFASWMVYDNQEAIEITDKRMDATSKMMF